MNVVGRRRTSGIPENVFCVVGERRRRSASDLLNPSSRRVVLKRGDGRFVLEDFDELVFGIPLDAEILGVWKRLHIHTVGLVVESRSRMAAFIGTR